MTGAQRRIARRQEVVAVHDRDAVLGCRGRQLRRVDAFGELDPQEVAAIGATRRACGSASRIPSASRWQRSASAARARVIERSSAPDIANS